MAVIHLPAKKGIHMLTLSELTPLGIDTEEKIINLIRLAKHLTTLPDKYCHFNMGYFFGVNPLGEYDEEYSEDKDDQEWRQLFFYDYNGRVYKNAELATDPQSKQSRPHAAQVPEYSTNYTEQINVCGTVGCAIGHGPLIGIFPNEEVNDWFEYSNQCFIGESIYTEDDSYGRSIPWNWCFDSNWSQITNTPKAAGQRIWWLLIHGIRASNKDNEMGAISPRIHQFDHLGRKGILRKELQNHPYLEMEEPIWPRHLEIVQ